MIEEEEVLLFTSDDKDYEMSTFDIDWFRFVPVASDMVTHFKNNDSYVCTWDAQGTILKKDRKVDRKGGQKSKSFNERKV
ncbi:hypothetical protein BCR24_15765 [Enterococcus ureilyticus]|uniref:Uncharacterized protein n=1 Tax=Enterococcus ureilyticus TaxID=1131292 RepID=A0A1E5HCL3_9ENTE|nr:hypothetical protein [Enterococcus ureilyticus]MBM7690547.1 hypothetical protein [Enterococcus ureilyticus]OEG22400.1 hypothetical protein BCR24_15765 [Enterococcus ureilyticus]